MSTPKEHAQQICGSWPEWSDNDGVPIYSRLSSCIAAEIAKHTGEQLERFRRIVEARVNIGDFDTVAAIRELRE